MKHIILIVSLLMGVTLGVQAQPKALFDKTTHEFGTILWKNPVTATFKITNKGDKPLVISNVTTSCGCTVADWTKEPIAPGKTGIVSSTFDAKEDSPASRQASAANCAKKQVPNVFIKMMVYSPETPEADSISVILLNAGVKF